MANQHAHQSNRVERALEERASHCVWYAAKLMRLQSRPGRADGLRAVNARHPKLIRVYRNFFFWKTSNYKNSEFILNTPKFIGQIQQADLPDLNFCLTELSDSL